MNFEIPSAKEEQEGVENSKNVEKKEISPAKAMELIKRIQEIRTGRDEKIAKLNEDLEKIPQDGPKADIYKELLDTHRNTSGSIEKILRELD